MPERSGWKKMSKMFWRLLTDVLSGYEYFRQLSSSSSLYLTRQ